MVKRIIHSAPKTKETYTISVKRKENKNVNKRKSSSKNARGNEQRS